MGLRRRAGYVMEEMLADFIQKEVEENEKRTRKKHTRLVVIHRQTGASLVRAPCPVSVLQRSEEKCGSTPKSRDLLSRVLDSQHQLPWRTAHLALSNFKLFFQSICRSQRTCLHNLASLLCSLPQINITSHWFCGSRPVAHQTIQRHADSFASRLARMKMRWLRGSGPRVRRAQQMLCHRHKRSSALPPTPPIFAEKHGS